MGKTIDLPGSRPRIQGMDLVRSASMLFVLLQHYTILNPKFSHRLDLFAGGWPAVDLLFVLSGYLIGGVLFSALRNGKPIRAGEFYVRRYLRIYPSYFVILLGYAWAFLPPNPSSIAPTAGMLTLTQNLIGISVTAFGFSWSLCVEEHFYVLMPVLCSLFSRLRRPRGFVAGFYLAVVALGIFLRATVWQSARHADPGSAFILFDPSLFIPTYQRLDGLATGVGLALIEHFRPRLWERLSAQKTWIMAAGIIFLLPVFHGLLDRSSFFSCVLGFPALALGLATFVFWAAQPGSWVNRIQVPAFRWMADLVYPAYLTNEAILQRGNPTWALLGVSPDGASAFVLAMAEILVASLALRYSVERPFLKLRYRWVNRHLREAGQANAVLTAV